MGGVQMNIDDVSYCDSVCFAVPVYFVYFSVNPASALI